MQTTTNTQTSQPITTPTDEKASVDKRYIKVTDHNGKTRKVYDPDNRLGRKRLCLQTFVVYFQVFKDGEVIGHLERAGRGVYQCFGENNHLGLRFNVTEAIDLVMRTHKQNSYPYA